MIYPNRLRLKKRHRLWLSLGISFLITCLLIVAAPHSFGEAEARSDRLTQGVNLAHWFAQAPLTPEHFQTRFTPEDIQLIKELGFKHVRLPVDPEVLFNPDQPAQLKQNNLFYLDAALDQILAHDLAVIVDLHPQGSFKQQLYQDPAFVGSVATFWQSLAQHLSQRSPDQVFLEVLNEPDPPDPHHWYAIQRQLLEAMRRGAPDHTLIAAANQRVDQNWDPIMALEALTPVGDRNIVYNFHFYQPKLFVSQGATWGWDLLEHVEQVPYPSSPKRVAPLLDSVNHTAARDRLRNYGKTHWNAQKLEDKIRKAATWAKKHHVPLTCNEFGVYRKVAPPADRVDWIRDVRSLLETYDIGWTIWEYDRGFGVVTRENGTLTADPKVLQALFGPAS